MAQKCSCHSLFTKSIIALYGVANMCMAVDRNDRSIPRLVAEKAFFNAQSSKRIQPSAHTSAFCGQRYDFPCMYHNTM